MPPGAGPAVNLLQPSREGEPTVPLSANAPRREAHDIRRLVHARLVKPGVRGVRPGYLRARREDDAVDHGLSLEPCVQAGRSRFPSVINQRANPSRQRPEAQDDRGDRCERAHRPPGKPRDGGHSRGAQQEPRPHGGDVDGEEDRQHETSLARNSRPEHRGPNLRIINLATFSAPVCAAGLRRHRRCSPGTRCNRSGTSGVERCPRQRRPRSCS